MALTQMQLIQSLGEAMAWFERELGWDVPPTELRHLCGRIGELYAAVVTNGQMALSVNQKGYDVVASNGDRISVKTTAKMDSKGHIAFSASTLDLVDRVLVLRMNTDEMQIEVLLDAPVDEAKKLMTSPKGGKRNLPLSKLLSKPAKRQGIKAIEAVKYGDLTIRELENGSVAIERDGVNFAYGSVKPALRKIATELNIGLLNGNGNKLNTRTLGSRVIAAISALKAKG